MAERLRDREFPVELVFCYNFSFLTAVEIFGDRSDGDQFSYQGFFLLMHSQGTVAARMEITNASAGVTLGDGSLARASNGLAALLASALVNTQLLAQASHSLAFSLVFFFSFKITLSILSSICPVNTFFFSY